MIKKNIGIIADPEFPTEVAKALEKNLPSILKEDVDINIDWQIETITDEMVSVSENSDKLLDQILKWKSQREWDYTICLTDLPIFQKSEILLSKVNYNHQMAYISLPALGWFIQNRITKLVIQLLIDIHFKDTYSKNKKDSHYLNQVFLFNKIKKLPSNDYNASTVQYILQPRFSGYLTILLGMTHDNQPWTIMPSLKSVIAIAFGSGGYGMIFPTLWQLSHEYSLLRLIVFSILSILSLTLWIIQGHNLWEKPKLSQNKKYRILYNTTTLITLLLAVSLFYIVLTFFFVIAAFVIVDPGYYAQQLSLSNEPTFSHYLQLAWMTASVGTLTGAVGVGLEDVKNVRRSTYGYRQRARFNDIKRKSEEAKN